MKMLQKLFGGVRTDAMAVRDFFRHFSFSNISLTEIALALLLPLSAYDYGFSNIGVLLLVFACVFDFFVQKKEKRCYLPCLFMLSYFAFGSMMMWALKIRDPYYLKNFVNVLITGGLILIAGAQCNIKRLSFWVRVVGVIGLAAVFFQSIQVYTLNQTIRPIRFLPMPTDAYYRNRFLTDQTRPMGIFLEPSQFALFASVLLFLQLKERRYVLAALAVLGILLSGSMAGYLYVVGIGICFIAYLVSAKKISLKIKIVFAVLIVVGFGVGLFVAKEFNLLGKLFSKYSSTTNRLFSGYEVFWNMPIQYKIFGSQFRNLTDLFAEGNTEIPFSQYASFGFSNSNGLLLVEYGIVGFIVMYAFLGFSLNDYLKTKQLLYPWLLLVIVFFIESSLFNANFILLTSILVSQLDSDHHIAEKKFFYLPQFSFAKKRRLPQ